MTLPTDLSCLPIAQLFVRESARLWGCPEADLYRFDLVIEEAVTNLIEHAFESDETSTFDLTCEQLPDGMGVTLRERGLPFDPANLARYDAGAGLEERSDRGMGIFLMKEVMDEVTFTNLGADGKETRFVKRFGTAAATRAGQTAGPAGDETTASGTPGRLAYEVRLMTPSEAIEISRCAYRSHGFTFFTDYIYYPEKLVEMNREGHMISAVAVARDGKFMGHAALVYPFDRSRIAELTYIFVNIEYRGQGCMDQLCRYLISVDKPSPLKGIYDYSVTNHVFTQRVMTKMGLADCGILLATSPASWQFKGIAGDASQRLGVVLSFKYLTPPEARDLYVPAAHRDLIREIYANLSAGHRFPEPKGLPHLPESPSGIEVEVFGPEGCAEVRVGHYGSQAVREVRRLLRELCLQQVSAVQLFLPLEDPVTACMAPEFEKLGFFFAGIMPEEKAGDALILQYLNNVVCDYDKVQTYTPMAGKILDYIRRRDPNEAL
jgi:serine/threonine-protein kinase RsbW